jgi:mannose-6-phosphate isomerase-like protein (cupin superfamily)
VADRRGVSPHIVVRRPDDPGLRLPLVDEGAGEAWALLWPGVGSSERAIHRIELNPGEETTSQRHPASEAVYFVLAGTGAVVDEDAGVSEDLVPRKILFVTPRTGYRFVATTPLALVGGPCPPDPALYAGVAPAATVRGDGADTRIR